MQVTLLVEGKPEGKDRPRFNPKTKNVYTPKKTSVTEREFRAAWEEQEKPRLPDDCALGMSVVVTVVRPKGHFNSKGELNKKGEEVPIPRRKPDLDNVIKLVMDALNTRLYKDDVQISQLHMWRQWGEWPSTLVRVYTL